jgi:hydroxymethylpyrimidine/phosphomethylpyrimidine kinase
MNDARMRRVLSIAGFDPSGGAGAQADLRTFAEFDVEGCAVLTALTAQNDSDVSGVLPVPSGFVALQLASIFDGSRVDAVKVGMLANAANAHVVADTLRAAQLQSVVVDPVLRATAGAALLDDAGLAVLRSELLPLATIITPNAIEAGALLDAQAPMTLDDTHDAARALRALGSDWVLITGGHTLGHETDCVDVLAGPEGVIALRTPRVPGHGIHGSGCRLSSAIAALLAHGVSVPEACARAQRHVADAIANGAALDLMEVS